MKKSFFLFSVFLFCFSFCGGQSWDWGAAGYSSYTNDFGSPVATDKNGNVYVTGDYIQSITFGSHTLNCSSQNSYLVKYNSSGTILWVEQPGEMASSDAFAASITTDDSGYVYTTGGFYGTVSFGSYILSTSSSGSVFLVKYSPSGVVLWAKQASASSFAAGSSLVIDKSGNIFVIGSFQGGTLIIGADTLLYPSIGSYAMFIAKFDKSGNALWAKQSNSVSGNATISVGSVVADAGGNAYITGTFYDSVSFGQDTLITTTGYSSFLIKYSVVGNVKWARQSKNASYGCVAYGSGLITDRANNIYLTGSFGNEVRFGQHLLYSPSSYSAYLTKYDTSGNVLWAKQSSLGWEGLALKSDKYSNIYLCGESYYNDDTLRFGNYTLTTGPWVSYASFLMKFDTSGNPICGSMLPNLGYYGNDQIASDSSGNYVYISGTFQDDTIICGSNKLISTNNDIACFVGRWISCSEENGINNISSDNSVVSVFPNPSNGIFTIQISNDEYQTSAIEVFNTLGVMIYNSESSTLKSRLNNSSGQTQFSIDLSNQPSGIYFYRVIEGNVIGSGKFIIEK